MKTNHKLVLAVLVGISIGVAGGKAIHAQQEKGRKESKTSRRAAAR